TGLGRGHRSGEAVAGEERGVPDAAIGAGVAGGGGAGRGAWLVGTRRWGAGAGVGAGASAGAAFGWGVPRGCGETAVGSRSRVAWTGPANSSAGGRCGSQRGAAKGAAGLVAFVAACS